MPFYDENTNPVEVDAGPQFGSANYDFSFLDNYLQSVGRPTKTNPDEVIDDNDNFYQEVQDADEPDSQETQLLHQSDDDATKAEDDNQFNDQGMEGYLFGDDEHMAMMNDLLNYGNDEEAPDATGEPVNGTPGTPGSLGNQISAKETQGKYTATNAHSSATGKYQFLWSAWGDSIKKVTGVKSQKEFLNSPQAQEKYYSFYEKSYLLPIAKKIKQQTGTNLTDMQVAKLVHFRGEGGAKKYLKGQLPDKPEAHNMAISEYIKQNGGVAVTPEQQFVGLNDPSLDNLMLPLTGTNTIRGLDSGEPVHVKDETGKFRILRGPKDTVRMTGKVYEKRLKKIK